MDSSKIDVTTPTMTIAATDASINGASLTMSTGSTGSSVASSTAAFTFSSDNIVLVGKDGSFDLDAMYEVRSAISL